jgi:hypothetical protein
MLLPAVLALACGGATDGAFVHPDDVAIVLTIPVDGGSFASLGSDTYRLSMHGVAASSGFVAHQPEPTSGQAATGAIVDPYRWDPANPPTAAVVVADPGTAESKGVLLLRILNPRYDAMTATLTADVQIDTTYRGEHLAPFVGEAASSLPASFGQASVVIESWWHHPSCGSGHVQCYLHYGCCTQPAQTHPLGNVKVGMCWSWSAFSCVPCHDDPCGAGFPDACGAKNCYTSCLNDAGCMPTGS